MAFAFEIIYNIMVAIFPGYNTSLVIPISDKFADQPLDELEVTQKLLKAL